MGETSIAKLQKSWAFSTSSLSILQGIGHFNVIALAALMAKVAVIDGVLFQRAIGTEIRMSWNRPNFGNITAFSRADFPVTGYFATDHAIGSAAQTEYDYSYTILRWISAGDGVYTEDAGNVLGCNGVYCVYGLQGVGFAIDCETTTQNDNFVTAAQAFNYTGNTTVFSVDWHWHLPTAIKNYSSLVMNTRFPVTEDYSENCPTMFNITQCELRPALVNYTVAYTNTSSIERSKQDEAQQETQQDMQYYASGEISPGILRGTGSIPSYSCAPPGANWGWYDGSETLNPQCGLYDRGHKQIVGVDIIKEHVLFEQAKAGAESKLAGIFNALSDQFTAEALLTHNDGQWAVTQKGALAPIAMGLVPANSSYCNYTYNDQTWRILQRLNKLMFQTSADSGLGETISKITGNKTSVPAVQYYKDIHYKVDLRFAFVAIAMTIFVVLCVLPSYWRFWILGREVTLGPLEIANAFRGPMFVEEEHRLEDVEKIMKTIGHKKVIYQPATRLGEVPGFRPVE